nr:HNH endonuclease [Aeromicrobium stalagmiti]
MTLGLESDPIARGDLWTRVQTTARANSRTIAVLRRRLKGAATAKVEVDVRSDERRRVLREVVARQGQGVFRQALLEAYDGKCAISGESCEAVLDAAHIDPYSGPKSNLVSNGLLLRTDLHTLFDLGLLRVDRNYRVRVDSAVVGTTYAKLDGKQIALPAMKSQMPSLAALGRRLEGH